MEQIAGGPWNIKCFRNRFSDQCTNTFKGLMQRELTWYLSRFWSLLVDLITAKFVQIHPRKCVVRGSQSERQGVQPGWREMALTKCRACSNGSSGTPADFCLPTQIDFSPSAKASTSAEDGHLYQRSIFRSPGNGAVTLHQAVVRFHHGAPQDCWCKCRQGPGSPEC